MNNYLYAANSVELNDFLDGSNYLFFTSKKIKLDYYKKLFEGFSEDKLKERYNADINREPLCQEYLNHYYDILTGLYGIICLTENENNILMWPHYTNETGFQIMYNMDCLEKSIQRKLSENNDEYIGFFPINYSSEIKLLDISEFKDFGIPSLYINSVKHIDWKYENEWRIMISKQMMGTKSSKQGYNLANDYITTPSNRYTYYDKNAIKKICLAPNFFTQENFVIEIISNKNIKVKPREKKLYCNEEVQNQYTVFLDFIIENFSEQIFQSAYRFMEKEMEKKFQRYIQRAQRKLKIVKEEDCYIITKLNDIY